MEYHYWVSVLVGSEDQVPPILLTIILASPTHLLT